jgi:hypothetical protein
MNPTDRPIVNPIVVLREEFDDWAVLFNPDTAYAAGTIEDIAAKVKNSFKDTPDAAFQEIAAFLNMLAENGFVGLELERT